MAEFELRIYSINIDTISLIELDNKSTLEEWSDEFFVECAEQLGEVITLCSLLDNDRVINLDREVYRAYLIDVNNQDTKPIRADYIGTIITSNKIVCVSSKSCDEHTSPKQSMELYKE